MTVLPKLKNQQVRDLAYSCFSAPLISSFEAYAGQNIVTHCSLTLTEQRTKWLQQLDQNPAPLQDYLGKYQLRRLGLYHEALWHFFLTQDDDAELVASNLQVIQDGQTLGEFDVIYRDKERDTHVHLELAFKVHLQAPSSTGKDLSQWLGPNVNDRLDRKLEHMVNHQSQLSAHDAAQELLESKGIGQVEREISLRGYLLGCGRSSLTNQLPDVVNAACLQAEWYTVSEVVSLLNQRDYWTPLPRLHWIAPVEVDIGNCYGPMAMKDYLNKYFEHENSPVMITAFSTGNVEKPLENLRIMVTPEAWPEGG